MEFCDNFRPCCNAWELCDSNDVILFIFSGCGVSDDGSSDNVLVFLFSGCGGSDDGSDDDCLSMDDHHDDYHLFILLHSGATRPRRKAGAAEGASESGPSA